MRAVNCNCGGDRRGPPRPRGCTWSSNLRNQRCAAPSKSVSARQSGKAQLANTTHARVAGLATAIKHTCLGSLRAGSRPRRPAHDLAAFNGKGVTYGSDRALSLLRKIFRLKDLPDLDGIPFLRGATLRPLHYFFLGRSFQQPVTAQHLLRFD